MDECIASEKTRGAPSGYEKYDCRCWKCATAKAVKSAFYHAKNREALTAYKRRYYEANREARLAYWRGYARSPAGRLSVLLADAKRGKLVSMERVERVKREYEEAYLDGNVA